MIIITLNTINISDNNIDIYKLFSLDAVHERR